MRYLIRSTKCSIWLLHIKQENASMHYGTNKTLKQIMSFKQVKFEALWNIKYALGKETSHWFFAEYAVYGMFLFAITKYWY